MKTGFMRGKKMPVSIVVIATLDTKWEETAYFKRIVEEKGHRVFLVDTGILSDSPRLQADFTRRQVAEAAGENIESIVELHDEREALEKLGLGASRIVAELYSSGRVQGVFALGGTMGTSLGLAAMKDLPLGVPKFILSTIALSPLIRPERVSGDVTLIPSVVDLWGLDSITKRMLENSAGAVVGAAEAFRSTKRESLGGGKEVVGVTTLGTSVCRYLPKIKPILEKNGYEVLVFHTIGSGGRSLELALKQGLINGVLDLATNELTNEVSGGSYIAGPDRLETAGKLNIPQVVSVGGIEAFGWGGPPETLPSKFRRRKKQRHSKFTFAVKASNEEMTAVGELIAGKLSQAVGPAIVVIPTRGFSERDKPGAVFYSPEGRERFTKALKGRLKPNVKVIELDVHINDRAFSEEVAKIFDALIRKGGESAV
jgi:uncharacterized protein (UPF0261 family)